MDQPILENRVVHLVGDGFKFCNDYLAQMANPNYTVKYITCQPFNVDRLTDSPILDRVEYTRCDNLLEVASAVGVCNLVVIEDLSDLFNLDTFRTGQTACAILATLMRELRRLAQKEGVSVLLYERQPYSSQMEGFMSTIYDAEVDSST